MYSGFRVDGTILKFGGLDGPLSKGHLEVCAIYSETTVNDVSLSSDLYRV